MERKPNNKHASVAWHNFVTIVLINNTFAILPTVTASTSCIVNGLTIDKTASEYLIEYFIEDTHKTKITELKGTDGDRYLSITERLRMIR